MWLALALFFASTAAVPASPRATTPAIYPGTLEDGVARWSAVGAVPPPRTPVTVLVEGHPACTARVASSPHADAHAIAAVGATTAVAATTATPAAMTAPRTASVPLETSPIHTLAWRSDYGIVVVVPAAPRARLVARASVLASDLPAAMLPSELQAAADLDGDGNVDAVVRRTCAAEGDVGSCELSCFEGWSRDGRTWQQRWRDCGDAD
jgi:hypothetical protein